MNLDDYNKRDRANYEGKARYADLKHRKDSRKHPRYPKSLHQAWQAGRGRTPGDSEFQDFGGSRHRPSAHWGLG
jgi:hypothetical protein